MKRNPLGQKLFYPGWLCLLVFLLSGLWAIGAQPEPTTPPTWHAQTLWQALGYMFIFAASGIAMAVAGYKLFDKCTPGDLHKEILENKNIAAAIVAAAVILGVCVIIAAAMIG